MNTYKRHRFTPDIISYAVWLYYRFNLSYRDIEDLLAQRGVTVSYETIRLWYPKQSLRSWGRLCIKFGITYAKRFFRRLLRSHDGEPRKIVTDKLRSYPVAHWEVIPESIHVTDRHANNRAEQSHESTRVRERGMRKFKSVGQAQKFLSAHAAVYNLFNMGRHLIRAQHYRDLRVSAFNEWSRR
jgi:putative transposase